MSNNVSLLDVDTARLSLCLTHCLTQTHVIHDLLQMTAFCWTEPAADIVNVYMVSPGLLLHPPFAVLKYHIYPLLINDMVTTMR